MDENNFVSTNPNLNADTSDIAGFPASDGSASAPSNVDMSDPDGSSTPSGFLGTLESWGKSAVTGTENAVKTVYSGAKTVVSDTVGGAEKVVTGVENSLTGDVLLILGVLVVGLVLIAQSGSVKVNGII